MALEQSMESLECRITNIELGITLIGIVIDKHLNDVGKMQMSRVMESFLTVAKNHGHDVAETIEQLELKFPE